jgi:hypothetical protein
MRLHRINKERRLPSRRSLKANQKTNQTRRTNHEDEKGEKINMKSQSLIPIVTLIACLGLLPRADAVNPPPDGGYPGFNTAEGDNALKNLNTATGIGNTAVGWFSLGFVTDGSFNTAVGGGALVLNTGGSNTGIGAAALILNTAGERNTAVGTAAMVNNSTGNDNTAVGDHALTSQTGEGPNTAVGSGALFSNTTGSDNTAIGFQALFSNTEDVENTACGVQALFSNTEGADNTAIGFQALNSNTTGDFNTANGAFALFSNTEGISNTANGLDALRDNTTGSGNTANGFSALNSNTEGFSNTATGAAALGNNTIGDHNTANGVSALALNTEGSNNTALGELAGIGVTTASNVICIGAGVSGANVDNTCFIGQIYSNVQPIVGTDPDSVTITSAGRLGRGNVSSRRYKHDIQPMDKASEVLYELKPVSFRYNKEYDATQTLAFGLVAEEVAEVVPDLVGRDPQGQPESVRYEQINAMLLNEFLKAHRAIEEQRKEIDTLKTQLKEQVALIQRVSDKVDLDQSTPRVVANKE